MVEAAAIAAAVLLAGVALFQLGLALGAPWGDAAYGGRAVTHDGRLPARFRLMSAMAVLVLALAAWIVLAQGGVLETAPFSDSGMAVATWALVGLLVLNTFANATSTSRVERVVMTPVAALLAVLCLVVALSS